MGGEDQRGRCADTVVGARDDRDVPSCHHGSLSGQRPGTSRAEASAAGEAQPSSRRKTPDAARTTGTGLVRARMRANPGCSHGYNQVGPVETTAKTVAMRRVYAFMLIK